jgi:hypothetical protein
LHESTLWMFRCTARKQPTMPGSREAVQVLREKRFLSFDAVTLAAKVTRLCVTQRAQLGGFNNMRGLRFAILSLLILAIVCLCPGSAAAHSIVRMKLVGVGGNNADGVYTYPYYFSINGKATVLLLCDTYDNQVTMGETWKAHESSLSSGKGLFGSQLLDYKAAGLIFKSILNGTVGVNAGNFAIWGLFSTNAKNSAFFRSGTAALDAVYLALAAKAPNSAFNGLVLYTPIAGTQSWGGTPQEYIGYSAAPEPATLTLFGTGLLTLAGLLRRKMGKV